jgi:hypothetical protein
MQTLLTTILFAGSFVAINAQVKCGDNRYQSVTPSNTAMNSWCQANCNQPGFFCPESLCKCVNPLASGKQCDTTKPRVCPPGVNYKATPGTTASNLWCDATCKHNPAVCPCTLCECDIVCAPLTNGGFSQGLTGWTKAIQNTAGDLFVIKASDVNFPRSGYPIDVPLAPAGNQWVTTDQNGPGSYVLFQQYGPIQTGDFLEFDWLQQNRIPVYSIQNTMDASVSPNQQFRVDLVKTTIGNWFGPSVLTDLVANVLSPETVRDTMALGQTWQHVKFDLTPYVGQTILIAFRSVDNQFFFNSQWDNVKITNAGCPASSTISESESIFKRDVPVYQDSYAPCSATICAGVYRNLSSIPPRTVF